MTDEKENPTSDAPADPPEQQGGGDGSTDRQADPPDQQGGGGTA